MATRPEEVTTAPNPELMVLKTSAAAFVGVLTHEYWKHPGADPRNSRSLSTDSLPLTLRSILGLLNAPIDSRTTLTLAYRHGQSHGAERGMHFSLEWSPSRKYQRGFMEILHGEDDTSVVEGVVFSTTDGPEAAERERIVRGMLTNPNNPFLQARLVGECGSLLVVSI